MWDIGKELGLDEAETNRIVQYLNGEYLVVPRALGGTIGISHRGVVEIEDALSNPERATTYFPPVVNIIQVQGDVVSSQIQQATLASQQVQINPDVQHRLFEFLSELEKKMTELKLDESCLRDLKADMETVKAQLKASKPKSSIIKDALSSIQRVLETAGATVLAAEIAKLLTSLV